MNALGKESIDLVVTSPPYWNLRDYRTEPLIWDGLPDCIHKWENAVSDHAGATCIKCGAWKGQLGLEPSPELFIKHLLDVFDLIKPVLKDTGSIFVNLGDTYSNSGSNSQPTHTSFGKLTQPGYQTRGHRANGLPPKCLCLIPQRFAWGMIERGWILRNIIIWHKPNCMPSSAKDRFTVDFEYLFFFTKTGRYYFRQQLEACKFLEVWSRKGSGPGTPYEKNNPRKRWGLTKHEIAVNRTGTYSDPLHVKPINNGGRNKRCVWTIPTKPFTEAHFAVYPPELIETPIKAGCPENGVVLDPFAGSGTTLKVARELGRDAIGIEISPVFVKMIQDRLDQDCEVIDLREGKQ